MSHPEPVAELEVKRLAFEVWCSNADCKPVGELRLALHEVPSGVFHQLVGHPVLCRRHALWLLAPLLGLKLVLIPTLAMRDLLCGSGGKGKKAVTAFPFGEQGRRLQGAEETRERRSVARALGVKELVGKGKFFFTNLVEQFCCHGLTLFVWEVGHDGCFGKGERKWLCWMSCLVEKWQARQNWCLFRFRFSFFVFTEKKKFFVKFLVPEKKTKK